MLARAAWTVVLVAALAGCAGAPKADAPDLGPGTPGDGEAAATTDASAPVWQVGQWWEWETSFGTETRPETFRGVVTQVTANGYVMASALDGMAKEEAAFGHPLLGTVSKELTMSGYGGDWELLEFPLTDGKTWQATIPNIAWDILLPSDTAQLAMRAEYDADLPGYRIMGHVDQGMVLEATYLPATGWFGELLLHDIDPGQEELEVGLRAVAAGLDFTGPTYTATADQLLVLEDGNGFDAPPPEGQPFLVGPQPTGSFTMTAGTLLYGVLYAEAAVGSRVITITDPANSQRQVMAQGDLEGGEGRLFLDEDAVAGTWQVATSGAGGYTYAFVQLYAVTLAQTIL